MSEDELGAAAEALFIGATARSNGIGLSGKLVMRQKRGRQGTQSRLTDEQRKIELLNRIEDPNYKREDKKRHQ